MLNPADFAVQGDALQRTISERAHDPLPQQPPAYETAGRNLINWGSPLIRKIGGGIAAIVLATGIGAGIEHALSDHSPSTPALALPNPERGGGLTLDNATPDQFYSDANFTDAQRIGWAMNQLQQPSQVTPSETVEQAAYDRIKGRLSAAGAHLVAPSVDNTPNQFNVQYLTVEAAATYEPDSDKGEKILAAIQDNQNPLLNQLRSTISDDHQRLSATERLGRSINGDFTPRDEAATRAAGHPVEAATPVTTNQQLGNINPNGIPSRIVQIDTRADGGSLYDEEFQSFVGGHWVVEQAIDVGSANWIPPQNLVNYFSSEK